MFAQPVYETIESNIKAYVIKRQQGGAGTELVEAAEAGAKGEAVKAGDVPMPSPFDMAHRPGSVTHQHKAEEVHHLPPVTESADMEGGLVSSNISLGQSNSRLRSRIMTTRNTVDASVRNSAPIPDLLPVKGERG